MTNTNQKNKLIIDTNSLYKHMKSVESCETQIYVCSSGVPTIGVGFALLIESDGEWDIRQNLFDESGSLGEAGINLPNDNDVKKIKKVLRDVGVKLKNNKVKEAKKLVKDNSTTLNKLTITDKQSKELFKILQKEYEGYLIERIKKKASGVDKKKAKEILEALSTDEQIAMFSTCYTRLDIIGGGVSNAVKNYTKDGVSEKDKAYYKTEAWYEIRYNSHKSGWQYITKKKTDTTAKKASGDNGLANRRYKDSLKFGLYGLANNKQKNLSQETKDGVLKFLNSKEGRNGEKVEETIKKYEKEFSPAANALGDKKQDKIEEIIKRLESKTSNDPVAQIKAEAAEKGRKLDNLSEKFLARYNQKYTLVLKRDDPIYYSIKRIEDYSDILIFQLMDKLVIGMKKEEELAKRQNKRIKRTKIRQSINKSKTVLEEIIDEIGGYERSSYVEDNQADLTHEDLKKKLVSAFQSKSFEKLKTKKSHKFFESFLTKEDKKVIEKEEEEKRKKRKEERRKAERQEEEQRQKRDRQKYGARNKRQEKKEGWIIYRENGSYIKKKRSDYYNNKH